MTEKPKDSLESIKIKVEERVKGKQKDKEFKDTSVVDFTRKYQASYDIITSSDLPDIEKDPITAYKLIDKSKVWPVYNVADQKEKGFSSGVVYLKTKIREALGSKPEDSKEAREFYLNSIQELKLDLEKFDDIFKIKDYLYTFYKKWGVEITKHFLKGRNSYGDYVHDKSVLKIWSMRFINQIKFSSDTAKTSFLEANLYNSFSKIQQQAFIDKKKEAAKTRLDKLRETLSLISNASNEESLKVALKEVYGVYNPKKSLEENKDIFVPELKVRIATVEGQYENPKLNDSEKEREENWSWAGIKAGETPKTKEEKDEWSDSLLLKYGIPKKVKPEPLSYIKRVGGLEIPEISVPSITKHFGYKDVVFGNYVKDKESKEHVRHFLGAMLDLSEIMNVNIQDINKMGDLSIFFGALGCGSFSGAQACYYPSRKAINLTKKRGDGTLAHEWSHYFDNIIGEGSTKKATKSGMATRDGSVLNNDMGVKAAIKALLNFFMNGDPFSVIVKIDKFRSSKYPKYNLYGATTASEAIEIVQKKFPNYGIYSKMKEDINIVNYYRFLATKFNLDEISVPLKVITSKFYFISQRYDTPGKPKYYTDPAELFARSFEAYVEYKLEKSERHSNYLASIVNNLGIMAILIPRSDWPYPDTEETIKIAGLFDNLIDAVKSAYSIRSFSWYTDARQDEYIELKGDKVEKVEAGVIVKKEEKKKSIEKEAMKSKRPAPTEEEIETRQKSFNKIIKTINPGDLQFFKFVIHDGGAPIYVFFEMDDKGNQIPMFGYNKGNFASVSASMYSKLSDKQESDLYTQVGKGMVHVEKIPTEKYANAGMKREILLSIGASKPIVEDEAILKNVKVESRSDTDLLIEKYKGSGLNEKEIITLEVASIMESIDGKFPTGFNIKDVKKAMPLLLKNKLIHLDTLKYTGVIRLTEKGKELAKKYNSSEISIVQNDITNAWMMTRKEYEKSVGAVGYNAESSAISDHNYIVRNVLNSGQMDFSIKNGLLTKERAAEIIKSAGIEMPLSFAFPDYNPPINIQTWKAPASFTEQYPLVSEHAYHSEHGWRIPDEKIFSDGKIEVKIEERRRDISVSVREIHPDGYRDISNMPTPSSHLDYNTFENEESLNTYLLTIKSKFSYVYKTTDEIYTDLMIKKAGTASELSKADLQILINQLEVEMKNVLDSGDLEKSKKLNELIGSCIDLLNKADVEESFDDCLKRNGINLEKDSHRFGLGTIVTDNLANIKLKVDSFNDTTILFDRVYAFGKAMKAEAHAPVTYSQLIETFKTGGISVEGFLPSETMEFARVLNTIQNCIKMEKIHKEKEDIKDEAFINKVDNLLTLSLEEYNKSDTKRKEELIDIVRKRISENENGLKNIGFGYDPVFVEAGKKFLNEVTVLDKPLNANPIYLKEVIIKWQEGSNTVTNKSYASLKEVERQMGSAGSLKGKDVYYDKNKLLFIWEDGHTEEDRVDVGLSKGDFNPETESLDSYLKESIDELNQRLNRNYVLGFKEVSPSLPQTGKTDSDYEKESEFLDKSKYKDLTLKVGAKYIHKDLGEVVIKFIRVNESTEEETIRFEDQNHKGIQAGVVDFYNSVQIEKKSTNSKEEIKEALSGLKILLSLETDKKVKSEIKEAINGLKILLTIND
jgi:hypothetical protein